MRAVVLLLRCRYVALIPLLGSSESQKVSHHFRVAREYLDRGKKPPKEGKNAPVVLSVFTHIIVLSVSTHITVLSVFTHYCPKCVHTHHYPKYANKSPLGVMR
jgi:hypothetical protein